MKDRIIKREKIIALTEVDGLWGRNNARIFDANDGTVYSKNLSVRITRPNRLPGSTFGVAFNGNATTEGHKEVTFLNSEIFYTAEALKTSLNHER